MTNFINKNCQPCRREKQRGNMVIVRNIFTRRISSTFILLVFLIFVMLLLLPVSFASTARDPTLRSRLYEQFRCGNGICEAVETALICPEDCPGEPDAPNKTLSVRASTAEEKTFGGFERISTIVPDEELFDGLAPSTPVSSTFTTSSVPSSASSSTLFILVLLFLALIGVVVYALRHTITFQRLFGWLHTVHDDRPPTTNSKLPNPNYLLPTTNYLPPAASSPSTILSSLITKFTKKGLTPGEIYQRITRMGLWDDETVRQQLKLM